MIILTSNGLSSDKLLNEVKKHILVDMKKAALIVTADEIYKEKNRHVLRLTNELKSIGLSVDYFDIDYQNPELLENYDVIELIGGNPYYLLNSLNISNAKRILKKLSKTKIIIGCSAGSLVLQSSIDIIDMYSPEMNQTIKLQDFTTLDLVDVVILPHYNRFIKKYKDFEKIARQYEKAINVQFIESMMVKQL